MECLLESLVRYCATQGSACPLVLVFLLCRLQPLTHSHTHSHTHSLPHKEYTVQEVFNNTVTKIKLFLSRLDSFGYHSLTHQFPSLPHSLTHHSSPHDTTYLLSVMRQRYHPEAFHHTHSLEENTSFVSFHHSTVWSLQQEFYHTTQLDAWDTVPFQISSNTLVAHQYMDEVEKIIKRSFSVSRSEGSGERVCLVEIGAGHGILSYLLAKELRMRELNGVVICTDFHDTVFKKLLQLSWVREECVAGYLDFAVCGASATSSSVCDNSLLSSGLDLLFSGMLCVLHTWYGCTYLYCMHTLLMCFCQLHVM
jgi:hypothetical protein